MTKQVVDADARLAALDITQSCVVTAPAGSGKTELLTQRLLRLLCVVEQPEDVLAITFTRKAAAEMRERLLSALALGEQEQPSEAYRLQTWQLARNVLARDAELGWRLQQNSARLRLQTIDSLCQRIASEQPVLSLLGGALQPVDQAEWLYQQAVDALLSELSQDSANTEHLRVLAEFYHGDLKHLSTMLISMLYRREQWLASMVELMSADDVGLKLQACLSKWCEELLQQAVNYLQPFASQLAEAADFVGATLHDNPSLGSSTNLRCLKGLVALPPPTMAALPQWRAIVELLLTASPPHPPRKSFNKNQGLPTDKSFPEALRSASAHYKKELLLINNALRDNPQAIVALRTLIYLPDSVQAHEADASSTHRQSSDQQLLLAMAHCLVKLVGHLQVVFAEHGSCDHGEITLAALRVLGALPRSHVGIHSGDADYSEQAEAGAYAWYSNLKHILVDEYQDTSLLQYRLLTALTAEWPHLNAESPESPRTVFVVGDAMQSIYAFREARVQLFLQARDGWLGELPLRLIDLQQNFRSSAELVDWFNSRFSEAFPAQQDAARGGVTFAPAVAFADKSDALENSAQNAAGQAAEFYACIGQDAAMVEARQVLHLVQRAQQQNPNASIAILVRARTHLQKILPMLRNAGIEVHNSDIDRLVERDFIADIMLIVRAMHGLHDDVAWWALLRAPWCGLPLSDMQAVRDHLHSHEHLESVPALLSELALNGSDNPDQDNAAFVFLGEDTYQRLRQLACAIQPAWQQRERLSLRERVQACWSALGGDALVAMASDADAIDVSVRFFDELENQEQQSRQRAEALDFLRLEQRFYSIYADQAGEPGAGVYAMTIFKSKGLEFDTVIVPGATQKPRADNQPLLEIGERVFEDGSTGMLLYPKSEPKASDGDKNLRNVYGFLRAEKKLQSHYEKTRLLYVAATRAKAQLILTARVELSDKSDKQSQSTAAGHALVADDFKMPAQSSLLAPLCPAILNDAHLVSDESWPDLYLEQDAALATPEHSKNSFLRLDTHSVQALRGRAVAPDQDPADPLSMQAALPSSEDVSALSTESEPSEVANVEQSSWQQAVGLCAHELMQLLVTQGPSQWQGRALNDLDAAWSERLRQLGVRPSEMQQSLARLQRVMQGILSGNTGLQLFEQAHRSGITEWQLLSRDNQAQRWARSRVDLVFIEKAGDNDSDGLLWVVDYKVAEPATGQSLADFLSQQAALYREQLQGYCELIAQRKPALGSGIKAALYFPLIDQLLPIELG